MKDNIILDKSFEFAIRVVKLYKHLCEKKEYILSKQLLRSGTSIGANINEAQAGQSKKDFIAKMSIASKEAREKIMFNYKCLMMNDRKSNLKLNIQNSKLSTEWYREFYGEDR